MRMAVCFAHGEDDSASERAGRAPSQAESPGGDGWLVAVGLPAAGDSQERPATDDGGVAGTSETAHSCGSERVASGNPASRTRESWPSLTLRLSWSSF